MKNFIHRRRLAAALLLCLLVPLRLHGHGLEGDRFFPPTPLTDDPFAVDELSLPNVQYNPASASREVDITGSFSKEVFPKFALSVQDTYINLNPKGGPAQDGWSPITLNAKYQLWEVPEHEFILSIGSDFALGGTGSKSLYSYDYYTTYTPNLYIGKGFNELPDALKFFGLWRSRACLAMISTRTRPPPTPWNGAARCSTASPICRSTWRTSAFPGPSAT